MTAKERVLAVYPMATARGFQLSGKPMSHWIEYATGGTSRTFDSEEAAWQNAAESLPAQPERKEGLPLTVLCAFCGSKPFYSCINRGTQTPMPFFHATRVKDAMRELVAPVGAKEKPICICGHEENRHWPESRDNFKLRRCSDLGCSCEDYIPVAEPKPNPSATALDERVCLNCERVYGDHWGPQNHCREGGEETWRYVHPSALPDSAYDSSSISTEQTFILLAEIAYIYFMRHFMGKTVDRDNLSGSVHVHVLAKEFDAAWAAAKGQSNGR